MLEIILKGAGEGVDDVKRGSGHLASKGRQTRIRFVLPWDVDII